MSVNQLYANGRIAVMSTRLLGADKFTRLAESNTLSEAVKTLSEAGYGGGAALSNPNDYETLLVAELDEALKTLKELCLNKHAVSYFLAKYDYLNAKALMKSKYMRVDGLAYCYKEATIPPQKLQEAFVNDDYSACSKNMAEACDAIDTEYANGNRAPSVVDKHLDKAMFADMLRYAKKCRFKYSFVGAMYRCLADTVNLMTVYRVKKAGLDVNAFADMIVNGGSVSRDTLIALFEDEAKSADLDYENKRFYELCKADNISLIAAESEQKARLFKILKENANLMTIQPVLEYFFLKVGEIDRIRRIAVAIKAGMDKDKIKEILK